MDNKPDVKNPVAADENRLQRRAYSIDEVCKLYGLSRPTFYRMLAAGDGPATFTVGRRRLVTLEALQEWERKELSRPKAIAS